MISAIEKIGKILTGDLGRILIVIVCAVVGGYLIAKGGIIMAALPMVLSIVVIFSIVYIKFPQTGIYGIMVMGFLTAVLSRYFPFAPYGLLVDAFLVLTLLILFFKNWQKFDISPAKNDMSLVWILWLGFIVLMIVNPLARSIAAWFYAMRGLALYSALMIPIAFLIFKDRKDMDRIFILIILFEIAGTIWGIKQLFIGVSPTEQRWLDAGAASTHVLFGKLRVFSYFSDAAQFGASQAHIAFISGVFAYAARDMKMKIFFAVGALFCLYGLIISGSRGPLVIPAAGGIIFLFFSKKFKLFFTGMFFGLLLFSFLKFTTIMQSNSQVARIRTALNPSQDPSFVVRLEREKILSVYLSDKPIGGGVGSAGFWGKRFSPGTFLAEIGTDGHYTRVWMETGIIGLWIYLGMFIFVFARISSKVWILKDDELRLKIAGLVGSFVGLATASYTNGLIIQLPTGPILYLSLVFIYRSPIWEKEMIAKQEAEKELETTKALETANN